MIWGASGGPGTWTISPFLVESFRMLSSPKHDSKAPDLSNEQETKGGSSEQEIRVARRGHEGPTCTK